MKTIALLTVVLAGISLPARAQVSTVPAQTEKPKATCVCDATSFKPLTEKAKAVEAYWDARRKVKTATFIGGLGAIFGVIAQDPRIIAKSTEGYDQIRSEMYSAKAKAEGLGALKVTGDDIDGTIEIKLVKGVDYTVQP